MWRPIHQLRMPIKSTKRKSANAERYPDIIDSGFFLTQPKTTYIDGKIF